MTFSSSSRRLRPRRRAADGPCAKVEGPSVVVTTWVYPCASSSCALRRDAASRSASIESEGVTLNTTSQSWFARQGSPDVLTVVRTHERGRLFPCERPPARPLGYWLFARANDGACVSNRAIPSDLAVLGGEPAVPCTRNPL